MKARILSIALSTLLISCGNQSEQTIAESKAPQRIEEKSEITNTASPDNAHNSENSLDWAGSYKGILPCDGCDGIETELILKQDLSYLRLTKYLGKKNALVGELSGKFTWNKDKSIINLEGVEDGPSQYKVGENTLTQLDQKGNERKAEEADKYTLRK